MNWVQDPQGITWETFHTLGEVPVSGDGAGRAIGKAGHQGCLLPAGVKGIR